MRWKILLRNVILIVLGVGLGLLARLMMGVPGELIDTQRQFLRPVDDSLLEDDWSAASDFPLSP